MIIFFPGSRRFLDPLSQSSPATKVAIPALLPASRKSSRPPRAHWPMAVSRGAKRVPDGRGRGYKCSGSVADWQGDSSERGSQVAWPAALRAPDTSQTQCCRPSCRAGMDSRRRSSSSIVYTYYVQVEARARPVNP